MSKYIPGIIDYVPQIQPYKPDLNFVAKVLETKEAQYKAGYDKLSSLYGTLLQSPMLRTDNIELRNDFFNRISSEIQKISSLDLSLNQNVQAASQVFQPLIEDDYIMKDMAFTKQAYDALREGEELKNCIDKECKGKYWQGGIRAIQYQMEDFMTADRDSTLNFRAPEYVAATNIAKDAMQFMVDSKLKMTTVTQSPDGRYRITNTNGTQMIPYLNQLLYATFGDDQASIDYYNTQAYLMRKDEIANNTAKYGSKEAAEQAYLSEKLQIINKSTEEQKRLIEQQEKSLNAKTGAYESRIENKGIDLSDPKDKKFTQEYLQSLVDKIVIGKNKDKVDSQEEIVNPEVVPTLDLDSQRFRVDTAIANELMGSTLSNVAQNYAMTTMEQEVVEDKYALAAQEHRYRMALEGSRQSFEWRKMLADAQIKDQQRQYTLRDDLLKMKLKGEIEEVLDANGNVIGYKKSGKSSELRSSNPSNNVYSPIDMATGDKIKIEDLHGDDETSVSNSFEGALHQTYESMKKIHANLKQMMFAADGTKVNGVRIDANVREHAKEYFDDLFIGYVTPDGQSLLSEQEIKAKGVDAVQNVGARVMSFLDHSADFFNYNAIGREQEKSTLRGAQDLYYRELEDKKFNNIGVHNTVTGYFMGELLNETGFDDGSGFFSDPSDLQVQFGTQYREKLQALITDRLTNKNGVTMSREQFIAEATKIARSIQVASYPSEVDEDSQNNPNFLQRRQMPYAYGTDQEQINYAINEAIDSAGNVYDLYRDKFVATYNRDDNAPAFEEQRSLKSGYSLMKNGDEAGAYLYSEPMAIDVDSGTPLDLGAQDANQILSLVRDMAFGNGPIQVKQGSFVGLEEGSVDLADDERISKDAMYVLNSILSDIKSGNSTESRARFRLIYKDGVAGDQNKVGFNIVIDPNYIAKAQGSDKSPGVTRGYGKDNETTVSIIMDKKDASNLDIVKRNEEGIYSRLYNGEPFTVDAFKEHGGEFTYRNSPYSNDGSILTEGYMWVYDEDGNRTQNYFTDITPPGVTPDSLVSSWSSVMQPNYMQNMQMYEAQRLIKEQTGKLIKDPKILQAYINNQ